MVTNIDFRPVRRMTLSELETFLEKAADILRGNVDHSEFRGYVFALLFYKRINDVYEENVRLLSKKLGDDKQARDPRMHEFVVPDECAWAQVARSAPGKLGDNLNEAMIAIERANSPKFDGILVNPSIDFNAQETIPRTKLISLINHFGSKVFDRSSVPNDLFGNAYEFLIRTFASKAGKSSGEFYTPREVSFLLSEIVEPEPGHHICDWAAGSGGLLLECRRYIERHHGVKQADRAFFYSQESNLATYNISRINMILHGVRGAKQEREDSLRQPQFLEGSSRRLKQFDRIVMNPPFSLENWGYDDFSGGDPYERLTYGMPPRDNADYAWMQHVVKSLKPSGKAIVVMSQGILFRGQPEQTEAEDGRNQKADAEYAIRENFIKADLVECVIVLPSKIFYGNNVPACLVILNKQKAKEPGRKDKIVMIWASRHFESSNPQNLLRRVDCLRILLPWRAFGDPARALQLLPAHEKELIHDIEHERDAAQKEIEDAYAPTLVQLALSRKELAAREGCNAQTWAASPTADNPVFGGLLALAKKAADAGMPPGKQKASAVELKDALRKSKADNNERVKELKRAVKALRKLEEEAVEKRKAVQAHAQREMALLSETISDLQRICSDPAEVRRYFTLVERPELEANEFNLNLPRYVDTFAPEEIVSVRSAMRDLQDASKNAASKMDALEKLIASNVGHSC